jgi:AcrR family transcriptional regulator
MPSHTHGEGRIQQKERTRAALLAAAGRLIAEGQRPTLLEVAQVAGVSRATAYRYFATREALLLEAYVEEPIEPLDHEIRSVLVSADPQERVEALIRASLTILLPVEPAARALLQVAVDPDVDDSRLSRLRGERRLHWVALALEPVRGDLPEPIWTHLLQSVSLVLGIEALIVLRDLLELEPDEAVERACWSGRALVASALEQARSRER